MQRWAGVFYAEVGSTFVCRGGQALFIQRWPGTFLCRVGHALFYTEVGTRFYMQRWAHSFICRGGHALFYPKVGKHFFLFTLPRWVVKLKTKIWWRSRSRSKGVNTNNECARMRNNTYLCPRDRLPQIRAIFRSLNSLPIPPFLRLWIIALLYTANLESACMILPGYMILPG